MTKILEADFFPQSTQSIQRKPCILIVDDDCDFTRLAKIGLEKTGGYFVCAENDPAKAHQTAQNLRPDLILLDVLMPEVDGGEVAARIQSDPTLRRIPIVFLTALVTEAEAKSGLRIDQHPFLAKPISVPELVEAIEENLVTRPIA